MKQAWFARWPLTVHVYGGKFTVRARVWGTMAVLWGAVLLLTLAGLLQVLVRYEFRAGQHTPELLLIFDPGAESSFANWYQSLTLLLASVLLGLLWIRHRDSTSGFARHWLGLSALFLWFSMEEVVDIHERLITPLARLARASGVFTFAWVILGIPFVLAFMAIYARFWLALPPEPRRQFLLAGALYVGGALIAEMLAGLLVNEFGLRSLRVQLLALLEECLEMIGIVVFVHALLLHLTSSAGGLQFEIVRERSPSPD